MLGLNLCQKRRGYHPPLVTDLWIIYFANAYGSLAEHNLPS